MASRCARLGSDFMSTAADGSQSLVLSMKFQFSVLHEILSSLENAVKRFSNHWELPLKSIHAAIMTVGCGDSIVQFRGRRVY